MKLKELRDKIKFLDFLRVKLQESDDILDVMEYIDELQLHYSNKLKEIKQSKIKSKNLKLKIKKIKANSPPEMIDKIDLFLNSFDINEY